jgi:hypothetical protein
MTPKIQALLNELLVKNRLYIDAVKARDEALAVACGSQSAADERAWEIAMVIADEASSDLDDVIQRVNAARR